MQPTIQFKACPQCHQANHAETPVCPRCGHVFRTQYLPPQQTQFYTAPAYSQDNVRGMVIGSVLLSLIALLFCPPITGGIAGYIGYKVHRTHQNWGAVLMFLAGMCAFIGMLVNLAIYQQMIAPRQYNSMPQTVVWPAPTRPLTPQEQSTQRQIQRSMRYGFD